MSPRSCQLLHILAGVSLVVAAACSGDVNTTQPAREDREPAVERYLGDLAPVMAGRVLSPAERERISAARAEGLDDAEIAREIVTGWSQEPYLERAAADLIQTTLAISGRSAEIDYELPANLVRRVVQNDQPWSTILTADTCVDGALEDIPCDSGAPYSAGLLTTRAYLASRASRFNLTRASTLMHAFACRGYPMEQQLEPPVERERLVVMFQADTPEEQEDPAAADAFGNGFNCYSCHAQFGPHSQLFVRFDESGLYRASATGLQDPEGELGRALGGLYASHFSDPAEAASESSQMFGQPVANLAEAAEILTQNERFLACSGDHVIRYGLGLDERTRVPEILTEEIARSLGTDATFRDLVVEVLSHPRVIESATAPAADPSAPDPEAEPESEQSE